MTDEDELLELLKGAKELARKYREITGKPLGITGEVAEYEAARILGLRLATARQPGYDATEEKNGISRKLQIKGRCLLVDSKRGQRVGSIKIDTEWNAVLLVLLDQNLDAFEIYEADRTVVVAALKAPGSIARNERGSLSISRFKCIGRQRWQRGG